MKQKQLIMVHEKTTIQSIIDGIHRKCIFEKGYKNWYLDNVVTSNVRIDIAVDLEIASNTHWKYELGDLI